MDKKSKIFFLSFAVIIAIVVTVTFCKYFILKDYYIEAQADCDPAEEKCFIWECDPTATEEGEKCTGDPEEDIWYYKKIKKIASDIPLCDPDDEGCEALICHSGEDCQETLCDRESAEGEIECNDPEKYLEENPPEDEDNEEAVEDCDLEEDEDCVVSEEEGGADSEDVGDSEESGGGGDETNDANTQGGEPEASLLNFIS